MPSNNLATAVVPEYVELAEGVACRPLPRLVGAVLYDPLVGEYQHLFIQDAEHPRRHWTPVKMIQKIRVIISEVSSSGRSFFARMLKFGVCAGSGNGLNMILISLVALTILCHGDPTPTPAPTPIPF